MRLAVGYARFCLKDSKHPECLFLFWTLDGEVWDAQHEFRRTISGPAKGLKDPQLILVSFQRIIPKLRGVLRIFVGDIDGSAGTMARTELIALLANRLRFQLVTTPDLADAIIGGQSETLVGATITESEERGRAAVAGLGSIAKITGGAVGGVGGVATGKTTSKSSTETLTGRSLVVHLTIQSEQGEMTVWGWNDLPCSASKAKCAIEDLVACAGTYRRTLP